MYSHPHEAIHEQLRLLRWWEQYHRDNWRGLTSHKDGQLFEPSTRFQNSAAALNLDLFESASPTWVDRDISDGLLAAMSTLPTVNPLEEQDIPFPAGFALLGGKPWPAGGALGTAGKFNDDRIGARALAWKTYEWGVYLFGFGIFHPDDLGITDDPLMFSWSVPWSFGESVESVPDDALTMGGAPAAEEREEMIYERSTMYALWSFMAQKIVGTDKVGFGRAIRRSLPANYHGEHFIREIVLRSYAKHESHGDTEEGGHLTARHIVRGHWRNQWYPSRDVHKPLWIEAYIKGPEGTPLRDGTQLVKVVR